MVVVQIQLYWGARGTERSGNHLNVIVRKVHQTQFRHLSYSLTVKYGKLVDVEEFGAVAFVIDVEQFRKL